MGYAEEVLTRADARRTVGDERRHSFRFGLLRLEVHGHADIHLSYLHRLRRATLKRTDMVLCRLFSSSIKRQAHNSPCNLLHLFVITELKIDLSIEADAGVERSPLAFAKYVWFIYIMVTVKFLRDFHLHIFLHHFIESGHKIRVLDTLYMLQLAQDLKLKNSKASSDKTSRN